MLEPGACERVVGVMKVRLVPVLWRLDRIPAIAPPPQGRFRLYRQAVLREVIGLEREGKVDVPFPGAAERVGEREDQVK